MWLYVAHPGWCWLAGTFKMSDNLEAFAASAVVQAVRSTFEKCSNLKAVLTATKCAQIAVNAMKVPPVHTTTCTLYHHNPSNCLQGKLGKAVTLTTAWYPWTIIIAQWLVWQPLRLSTWWQQLKIILTRSWTPAYGRIPGEFFEKILTGVCGPDFRNHTLAWLWKLRAI